MANLLNWIRRYNESNGDNPIHLFGYDIQQPWHDYPALSKFLNKAVPERSDDLIDGLETNIAFEAASGADFFATEFAARMYDHEAESEVRQRYGPCDEGLETIERLFDEERDELIDATSKEEFAYAELRLVGLRAWMDDVYHSYGLSDLAAGNEARDRGMAFALSRLHELRCPDAQTAVWAHNMHLTRAHHRIRGGRSMGTFLAEKLGDEYRCIGLIGRVVETNWNQEIDEARKPVTDPRAIETMLASFEQPYLLYDLDCGDLLDPGETCVLNSWEDVVPSEQFDALLFVDHSPPRVRLG